MRVAAVVSSRPAESLSEVTQVLRQFVDKHRDSPVARVVEVKRLLDALLLREPGDHREYDREAEAGGVIKEEGREAGAGVAAEQGSGGGDSEHKPKKKRVKAE